MSKGNLLFESIFKRNLSDTGTRDYLAQVTNDYPYFSPAQFFLLATTEKGTAEYNKQAAKTSALFNNPYWLQFQLQEAAENSAGIIHDSDAKADENFIQTVDGAPIANIIETPTPGLSADKTALPEKIQSTTNENVNSHSQAVNVAVPDTINPEENTEFRHGNKADLNQPEVVELDTPIDIIVHPKSEAENLITETGVENLPDTGISNVPLTDNEAGVESGKLSPAGNGSLGIITHPVEDETLTNFHSGRFNTNSTPLVNETDTEENPVRDEEIAPLNFKLNLEPAATNENTIVYEPLHTSDYFASLGIKLSGEIKSSDKLGKQLKSFTEWLKTMKKIHNNELQPLSGNADATIQILAEQSNKEDTVLTEAMADVLLQQGKTQKAVEVYKKLSLLNPSKSTYFAAKIDQLKEL